MKKQRIQHDNVDYQVILKSGIYTLTDKNQVVVVNATGPVEVILPTATGIEGWSCEITRIDNTLNNVVVHGVDFQKVNGVDNFYINGQYMTVTFAATNTSASATPIPGYYIRSIHEPPIVQEAFSALLDFNREKKCFLTASSNINYTASTRPKRYGKVIQHRIQSTSNATVSFPSGWFVYGKFVVNAVNVITFVATPDVTSETDSIEVNIRQATV